MTKWILGAALALSVAFPAGAAATTIEGSPQSFPYQQWSDEAKVATPPVTVEVVESEVGAANWPCGVASACAEEQARRIWFAPARLLGYGPRAAFYHELGHIDDWWTLTDSERAEFAGLVGAPMEPWLTAEDHETAGEAYAEMFAACARLGLQAPSTWTTEFQWPSRVQIIGVHRQVRICEALREFAGSPPKPRKQRAS